MAKEKNGLTIARVSSETVAEIQDVVDNYSLTSVDAKENIERALMIAEGMQRLRALMTPEVMKPIMELQGCRLGFRTDKDQGQCYNQDTVRDCVIEALLMGLNPVGNQFNIISGNTYVTQEGYAYRLFNHPDVDNFADDTMLKAMNAVEGKAMVIYKASWLYKGKAQTLETEIPVRVNKGMGTDAVLGKGERKGKKRVYHRITGTTHILTDGDVDDAGFPDGLVDAEIAVKDKAPLSPGRHARQSTGTGNGTDTIPDPVKGDSGSPQGTLL